MKIELLESTPNAEKLIESSARTCYQSKEDKNSKTGELILKLIKSGHFSVLEHASATFRLSEVSRALTHQLVRHRICSFSQQSQRYVNERQFGYVVPPEIEKMEGQIRNQYHLHMNQIQEMYDYWKSVGLKNEDARFVLPNACHTEIVVTANFREWRHIIELRCDRHAQWEIRQACLIILQKLHNRAPLIFQDLMDKFVNSKKE